MTLAGFVWEVVPPEQFAGRDIIYRADEGEEIALGFQEVLFQGRPYILRCQRVCRAGGLVGLDLRVREGHAYVDVDLLFIEHEEDFSVSLYALKDDPERLLPRALGMEMYRLALSMLQEVADRMGKRVVHTVQRDVTFGDRPLTIARWDELFLPLLLPAGYMPADQDMWVREYLPVDHAPSI